MQRLSFQRPLILSWAIALLFSFLVSSPKVLAAASTVSLNPSQGSAGTVVTASGSNWTAAHKIQAMWEDQSTRLGQTTVDSNGKFTISFNIPSTAIQGNHTIYFTDATGNLGYFIPQTFTVISMPSPNPKPVSTVDLQTLNIQSLQPLVVNSSPTLRANIRNNGSAASGNFNIRWIADGNIADGGHYSIPAGVVDTHDYIWHNLTSGQHTITFIANFDHSITESDYSNNQLSLTFTVKPASPTPVPVVNTYVKVNYISQFSGQKTQSEDCGPTSVAMVLSTDGKISGSPKKEITDVRNRTGKPGTVATNDIDLETALAAYGATYSTISPHQSVVAQFTQMQQAVNNHHPVIVFLNGNILDGSHYSPPGHWVVLEGYTSSQVIVNDPDSQFGGQDYKVSIATFESAISYALSVSHIVVTN